MGKRLLILEKPSRRRSIWMFTSMVYDGKDELITAIESLRTKRTVNYKYAEEGLQSSRNRYKEALNLRQDNSLIYKLQLEREAFI